jgi:cell wall-associated NlpC family hydrolase
MTLPLGAQLAITREDAPFAVTADGLFVPRQHLVARDNVETDFVAVAERFVATPYLWGGKTSLGIDCSGLVQIALTACGQKCPRDSDMQEATLGRALSDSDTKQLQRGDLIFWNCHVAIVRDAETIVHANAHHMATAIEPIETTLTRIAAAGSRLISIRRL